MLYATTLISDDIMKKEETVICVRKPFITFPHTLMGLAQVQEQELYR